MLACHSAPAALGYTAALHNAPNVQFCCRFRSLAILCELQHTQQLKVHTQQLKIHPPSGCAQSTHKLDPPCQFGCLQSARVVLVASSRSVAAMAIDLHGLAQLCTAAAAWISLLRHLATAAGHQAPARHCPHHLLPIALSLQLLLCSSCCPQPPNELLD